MSKNMSTDKRQDRLETTYRILVIVFVIGVWGLLGRHVYRYHYIQKPLEDSSEKYWNLSICSYKCQKWDSLHIYSPLHNFWYDSLSHWEGLKPMKGAGWGAAVAKAVCGCDVTFDSIAVSFGNNRIENIAHRAKDQNLDSEMTTWESHIKVWKSHLKEFHDNRNNALDIYKHSKTNADTLTALLKLFKDQQ